MNKRIVTTIVCLVLCVALAIVFGFVLWPMLNEPADEQPKETVSLVNGEVEGSNGRVQMFPKVSSENVRSLLVSNENGEYKIIRRNNALVIEGHEGLVLDQEKLIQMIVNAGYTLSTFRSEVTEADFEKYGLGEGQHIAYFELTTRADEVYTVYIGDRTLAGDGYYVRYPGRNAIYVLDNTIEKDLLGTVEYLVNTMIVYPADINAYILVPEFLIMRDGVPYCAIEYLNPDKRSELAAASVHRFSYPENYNEYFAGDAYTSVLKLFANFVCDEVVSIELGDDTLKSFGIDPEKPKYAVTYQTVLLDDNGTPSDVFPNALFFSEKQKDDAGEFYYVAAPAFGIIGRVDSARLAFLEYELDKFVSNYIFSVNINNVKTLSFKNKDLDVSFELSGDTNETLSVVEKNSGFAPETMDSFRDLWQVLLMIMHDGVSDISDDDKAVLLADDKNVMLEMTVITKAGNERVFKFYQYTDRRVFYTVNGDGEFYVTRTMIDKTIADISRLLNGEPIDKDARF
ncbi:MAG: DUF4340 domain-containing protein [Clostridia bacterium]|nr:DUF4340 domain-containing protein [Clostridia bacterium]